MSGVSHRNLSLYVFAAIVVAALLWMRARDRVEPAPDRAAHAKAQGAAAAALPAPPTTAPAPNDGAASDRSAPVRLVPAVVSEDAALAHGAFEGRVVNFGSSLGLAGAEVVFEHDGGAASVRTGEDGRFAFEPAKDGIYRLAVVTAEGFLPYAPAWEQSPIELTARPGRRIRGIIIYLMPAIDYRGVVVDADGTPVADAAIRLLDTPTAEFVLEPIRKTYTSDAAGEFVFHAPDNALLEAAHPERGTGRARLDRDVQMTHRLEIRLAATDSSAEGGGVIAGRIIDVDSQPVPGAEVEAVPQRTAPGPILYPSLRTGTDEHGQFAFEGLDAASYLLRVTQQGYARGHASALPGDEAVEIVLEPAATIRGRVVGAADGAPVPAFTVAALRGETELVERVVAHTSVFDADGRFEISGLEHGEYSLRAMAYGYATSAPVRARATWDPDNTPEVTIALPAGGTLFGTVVNEASGEPLELARVLVEGQIGRGSSALPLLSTTVTDPGGAFELTGLSPGRASIQAAAFDHNPRIIGGIEVADGSRIGPMTIALSQVAEGEQPKLELVGIGVVLGPTEAGLEIQRLIEGGGAADAGLQVGEVITAIEGTSVLEGSMQDAVQRIRGPEGTQVVLTVKKLDGSVVTVAATRRRIKA